MAEPFPAPTPDPSSSRSDSAGSATESDRVWNFVRAQRRAFAEIEARLEAELARLGTACSELSAEATSADGAAPTAAGRSLELGQSAARLGELRASLIQELDEARKQQGAELARLQALEARVDERKAELHDEQARLRHAQRDVARLRELYQAETKQLAEDRERCGRRARDLDAELAEIAEMRSRTAAQRQRIAEGLRGRRAEMDEEFNHRRREFEESLVAVVRQKDQIKQQLTVLDEQNRGLEEQVRELQAALSAQQNSASAAAFGGHEVIDRLNVEKQQLVERASAAEAQIVELTEELNETSRELAGLQKLLAERSSAADAEQQGDLRRRLEMAVDDLKIEKARSAELQRKLAQAPAASAAPGDATDWESQKRRLLATLEADDAGGPQQKRERLQIEEAILATDRTVAEKDREIEELQTQLLAMQRTHYGTMAVGAAAVADVLDKDEIIRQERENLQQLQHEWREKLRRAEVDISVERAKLARERADLEEKLRLYEDQQAQRAKHDAAAPKDKPAKPDRGRWLTRLGLKDE